jgi:hypothetical protein
MGQNTLKFLVCQGKEQKADDRWQRAEGIWDCGLRNITFWIWDCAHVKPALPFHIRENLTGQGVNSS